uniref:Uncharacterized protein n=1 Tax=Glossina brevipalpis TaxID=37001 RepID=A0A1A9WRH4_9MUSC
MAEGEAAAAAAAAAICACGRFLVPTTGFFSGGTYVVPLPAAPPIAAVTAVALPLLTATVSDDEGTVPAVLLGFVALCAAELLGLHMPKLVGLFVVAVVADVPILRSSSSTMAYINNVTEEN